jgi:amino acid adenylation domain-containing protein
VSAPLSFSAEEVEGSLPARFARVASVRAGALALAQGPVRLTYAEADRRSDALAVAIGRRAAVLGAPVVILVSDPVLASLCVVATWKVGGCCVPLNPANPAAYLAAIIRDAEAASVVTDARGAAALDGRLAGSPMLLADQLDLREPAEPRCVPIAPGHPACVLYTSGSTGEPKGVVRSHRALLHRVRCALATHGVGPDDRVSLLHSLGAMPGMRDLTAAFSAGAALLPWDMAQAGPRALADWIERESVTVLGSAVSMFRPLLAEPGVERRVASVRLVHLGSEPLYRQDVERFRERFTPGCVLVASYGATEFSPITEHHVERDTPLPDGRVPAGHALEGAEVLIVDDDGRPVEAGEPGEVVVRSRFLSDGYWRRPDLTRERYAADSMEPGVRVYRTGDVGRLAADGCLTLLGRKDDQVKVRGFRVHPGQVEAALIEHEAIRQAVVTAVAGDSGDLQLVAYLVSTTTPPPTAAALRGFLRDRVPAHLLPSAFVVLDAMPLNVNGKAARAALPPPRPAPRPEVFVTPRTPLEHQIAALFEELFDAAPIGATDDFFDLGGDSLLAAALLGAIEQTCGRALGPSALLESPTVAGLAAALQGEDRGLTEPLTVLRASGARAPLVFVHNDHGRGLYTHALGRALDPDRPVYAIHLHGFDRPLPATVHAIAAERVRAVRAIRPHGPYVLGGHCYGGIVALEMARQLRAAGERVDVVVLVDTPAPAWLARAINRAAATLARVAPLSAAARASVVARAGWAAEIAFERARSGGTRFAGLARAARQPRMSAVRRRLMAAVDHMPRLVGAGGERGLHAAPVDVAGAAWRRYRRAIRSYVPAAYDGPVVLFRAEALRVRRPDLGWTPLLSRFEVEMVPGDHHTWVTRHVAAFASRLEARLQRAPSATP